MNQTAYGLMLCFLAKYQTILPKMRSMAFLWLVTLQQGVDIKVEIDIVFPH